MYPPPPLISRETSDIMQLARAIVSIETGKYIYKWRGTGSRDTIKALKAATLTEEQKSVLGLMLQCDDQYEVPINMGHAYLGIMAFWPELAPSAAKEEPAAAAS